MCMAAVKHADGKYSFSRLTEKEILLFRGSTSLKWIKEGASEFLFIQSSGYWEHVSFFKKDKSYE